jgi:uncharacterized membrane protein YtjA (UPF0391 family)
LVSLFIAIVAGVFVFSGIYVAAAEIAKPFFFVFALLFVVGMVSHGARRYSN